MKATFFLALLALLPFCLALHTVRDTNAYRLAHGLPPLRPRHLYQPSRVDAARKARRSIMSTQCTSGTSVCCPNADTGGNAAQSGGYCTETNGVANGVVTTSCDTSSNTALCCLFESFGEYENCADFPNNPVPN